MATYSFTSLFYEVKFFGVLSCVFLKLGYTAIGGRLQNTAIDQGDQTSRFCWDFSIFKGGVVFS
jgi:hypothetical protein